MRYVVAQGSARCGGHITLLFTVDDRTENLIDQGSRGLGFCVSAGLVVTATLDPSKQGIEGRIWSLEHPEGIQLDSNQLALYQTVNELVHASIPHEGGWTLEVRTSLPLSHGFGMSAAGCLASTTAMMQALGFPRHPMIGSIAHRVERLRSGGLGDVVALLAGGVEARMRAGLRPEDAPEGKGIVQTWSSDQPVVLVWGEGSGTRTTSFIDDPTWARAITTSGETGMEGIDAIRDMELEAMFELANRFASDSGLDSVPQFDEMRTRVSRVIGSNLPLAHCLLGPSVAVLPRTMETGIDVVNRLRKEGLNAVLTRVERRPLGASGH